MKRTGAGTQKPLDEFQLLCLAFIRAAKGQSIFLELVRINHHISVCRLQLKATHRSITLKAL